MTQERNVATSVPMFAFVGPTQRIVVVGDPDVQREGSRSFRTTSRTAAGVSRQRWQQELNCGLVTTAPQDVLPSLREVRLVPPGSVATTSLVIKQNHRIELQPVGNSLDSLKRQIPLPSLQSTDVSPVPAKDFGKCFLR
jgi:hypothetical protein